MNGMIKYVVVSLFTGLFGFLNAQLLDNSQGKAFTEYPFFNTRFIKASKIKEIKGSYTFKKQGDIVNDTVVRYYTYDGSGNLLSLRINEKRGFMTTYYTYDDQNRVVKEEVWRDIDTLHSLLATDIERSILWNSETMTYEEYPSQLKRKRFNSYGNQYFENTTTFDSLGYLVSTHDLYTITRDQYTTKYTYANKGWIDRMQVVHNIDSIPLSEMVFAYDQYGNLTSKQEYKNGVFTTEYQVIYSGDTGMLSSVLIREVSSNFISIIRFAEPVFWE